MTGLGADPGNPFLTTSLGADPGNPSRPGYELKVLTCLINICDNLRYIRSRDIIGGYSLTVAQIVTMLLVDIDTPYIIIVAYYFDI